MQISPSPCWPGQWSGYSAHSLAVMAGVLWPAGNQVFPTVAGGLRAWKRCGTLRAVANPPLLHIHS